MPPAIDLISGAATTDIDFAMYGLVNRAVEGLVVEKFGAQTWQRICERAELRDPKFVAMDAYDDAVTYALVAAASEELALSPAQVLEAFGEYWTAYTIEEGYGDLLSMMGDSLEDFLENLDSMHARIGGSMPDLVPPSFEREAQDDGSSILHYRSDREGLWPMVVGLLKGLAKRFDVAIEVTRLEPAAAGHERFLVRRA
jgi:hypothetical protein